MNSSGILWASLANIYYFLIHQLKRVLGTQKNRLNGSFEYPIHMLWLRNKKIIFRYALLSWDLGLGNVVCLLYRLLRLTNLQ